MASAGTCVLAVLAVLGVFTPVSSHDTVCTYIYNATCIDALKVVLDDDSVFWFGTDYPMECPQGPASGRIECNNFRADFNDSLMTRLMGSSDATSASIKFVANVTYTLPAERSYMGCGAKVEISDTEVKYKKIDPISGHSVRPFDASTEPNVTWPATDGVKYTVVYYDAGYAILHGIYINVDGGDISLGEVAVPHRGPKNTLKRKNPYIWAVFTQNEDLVLSKVKEYAMNQPMGNFMLAPFISEFNLTGPVGINTVRATRDEYAAAFMRRNGVSNMCPMYMQQRIQDMVTKHGGLTFNVSKSAATMSIDLHFVAPPMSFPLCCKNQMAGAVNKTIDYMTPPDANSSQVRGRPRVRVFPARLADTLQGEFFTLMIVDPSMEFNTSTPNSIVHWLVVNIPSKDIASGHEVLSYLPLVPGKMDRMFLVLLYKQAGENETIKDITGLFGPDCPAMMNYRCKFKVAEFAQRSGLVLTGVRFLKVKPDDYSRHRHVKDKHMTEKEVCTGRQGYTGPCETDGSPVLRPFSVIILVLTGLMAGLDKGVLSLS